MLHQALGTIVGGLLQGSAFTLVALGFALIFRVTGTVNLAQGPFVVLGALFLYTFHQTLGWPLWGAFPAALACSVAIGVVTGYLVFEPGLRKLPPSGIVMITGGLLTLFEGLILLGWGSQPYQLDAFNEGPPYDFFSIHLPTQTPWTFGLCALTLAVLWYVLQKTALGKALRACAENPAAAALMGIDVRRMTIFAFAVASGIGAISGMVIGPLISLQFNNGGAFTLDGFIAVTLGGIGSFFGSVVGGLGLGVVEQLAAGYISSLFATSIVLVLLLVVLMFRPQGLLTGGFRRREDVREHVSNPLGGGAKLNPRAARVLGALLIAAIALAPVIAPAALLASFVIAGIFYISILGLDVLMGYCGQVSLGHPAFMATGAYGAAICSAKLGWPPLAGVAAGLFLSLVCAAVLSSVTVKLRGHYLALATMAFALLVDSLTVGLGWLTGGPSGLTGIPAFSIGGFAFLTPAANYYLVWVTALTSFIIVRNAMQSDFGRALRSIRTDQTAALALGIDVPRYKLYAVLISATFASLSGSLLAYNFQFLSPEMVGTQQTFLIVTMLVIGGEGTLIGPLIGVVLLTLLPTMIQPLATYKTLATGLLLVVALLYLPTGIYGAFVTFLNGRKRILPIQGGIP